MGFLIGDYNTAMPFDKIACAISAKTWSESMEPSVREIIDDAIPTANIPLLILTVVGSVAAGLLAHQDEDPRLQPSRL